MRSRPDPGPRRRERREFTLGPWLAVFAVAAAARALAVVWGGVTDVLPPDPRLVESATQLAQGHGLSLATDSALAPTSAVPPLAPALLALVRPLLGARGGADAWLGCLLGSLVPLLVGQLATTLHGPTVGRLAGWISAVDPLVVGGAALLQEQVFSLSLLAALVLAAHWLRTPRIGRAWGCGAAWGACALAWTPGIALALTSIAWAWSPLGLVVEPRQRLRHLGVLALGAACIALPWTIRNALVMHAAAPVTTSSGIAFLSGNHPDAWSGQSRGGPVDVLAVEPYASRLRGLEPQRDAEAWRAGAQSVRDAAPVAVARAMRDRIARVWTPWLVSETDGQGRWPWPVVLGVAAVSMLGLLGLARALSGARRWFQALPALVLVVVTVGSAVFYGSSRTRLGIEPLVALLAALGLQDARRRLHLQRTGLRLVTRSTARS